MIEVSLGDIAEHVNERITPKAGDEKNFIGLQHLVSGSLQIKSWGDDITLSAQAFKVKKGDIIFARRNTYLKRVSISPIDGLCSADAIVIRPKESKILRDLLPLLLQSEYFMNAAISFSAGSLSSRVKWKDLKEIRFKLPDQAEQERLLPLVKKLRSIIDGYELILDEVSDKRNFFLNKLLRGLKCDMDCRLDNKVGLLADGYEVVKLGSLLSDKKNSMRSGPFGSALKKEHLSDTGIPLLGIDNVFKEKFVNTYKRYVPLDIAPNFEKFKVFEGDVMITIMGTVGRACVFPKGEGEALSSKHLWTMTFDSYPSEIIAWQLNYSTWVQHHFSRYSQGGIMDAISSKVLKECPIVLPPKDRLSDIRKLNQSMQELPASLLSLLNKYRLLAASVVSDWN